MRWLDCLRTCRIHFCRRPSPRQAAWLAVAIVAVGAVIILTAVGLLQKGADHVRSHFGLWGYVVYGALITYTGLPFGYGWSFFVIASGYTFGWRALIPCNIGTLLGVVLGFSASRRCMRQAVEDKVASLPPLWEARIRVIQGDLGVGSLRTYLSLVFLLRSCGALTFGLVNAFDAALTDVSLRSSMLGAFLSAQWSIPVQVYLGTLARELYGADGFSGAPTSSTASTASIVAQICFLLLLLLAVALWARHRLKSIDRRAGERVSGAGPPGAGQGEPVAPSSPV